MTTKKEILQTIRQNCIECCGGSPKEVSLCPIQRCPMHPFRMGRDPNPARRKAAENLLHTEAKKEASQWPRSQ